MHLTYRDFVPHKDVASAPIGRAGAPENEIEVTPEMMSVGGGYLCREHDGTYGERAAYIYRAMERVRRGLPLK